MLDTLLIKPTVPCSAVGSKSDPGVASTIPAWSHTFMEIDHEIVSMVILLQLI